MASLDTSMTLMRKVAEALGLDSQNRSICRIVLDLEVGSVAKVYVAEYVRTDAAEGIAGALSPGAVEVHPVADVVVDGMTGAVSTR
jgi:hypothetical protein